MQRSAGTLNVRNLLRVPGVRGLAENVYVREVVDKVLGPGAKPVRAILFDKTPAANWNVLWHQDLSVAVINYPLCPDVSLARIVEATRRAFAHLWREILTDGERGRIAVTGHSATAFGEPLSAKDRPFSFLSSHFRRSSLLIDHWKGGKPSTTSIASDHGCRS